MAKHRWMVKAEFGEHAIGDIITSPKVAAEHPDHVLRLPEEQDEPEPAASPLTKAREAAALPPGPTAAGDASKPRRTTHRVND